MAEERKNVAIKNSVHETLVEFCEEQEFKPSKQAVVEAAILEKVARSRKKKN